MNVYFISRHVMQSIFNQKYRGNAMFDVVNVQIKNYLWNYSHFEIKATWNYMHFVFIQTWCVVHFVSWKIILLRFQNGRRLGGSASDVYGFLSCSRDSCAITFAPLAHRHITCTILPLNFHRILQYSTT